MCGICGILNSDHAEIVKAAQLRRMCDTIIHRGPDDDGYFVSGSVGLGVRRLSIIDLTSGSQPIHNEDSTIQIVFNGEIYNYPELRADLQARGHSFYTQSDTEAIVHAYEEYGTQCLVKLRGMFALALWDGRRQMLFLAIDRIGIKPLYYHTDEQGILFGSELECLLASGKVRSEIDFEALAQYFTYGYIPAPRSIYRGVSKLLPGFYLTWTASDGIKNHAYWDLPQDGMRHGRTPVQTRRDLREVLKDAVRTHLISDVPIGAFLSGGIDSSTVVALMSEVSAEPVQTFSIGFTERTSNELDKARMIAQRFGTRHHELIMEPETVDVLPKIVSHFGEPFADSSALPAYYVSKMAREYVKVALSGDGGDELFLGYTIFRGLEVARYMQILPAPVRSALGSILKKLPDIGSSTRADRLDRGKKRLSDSMLPPRLAFHNKIKMGGLDAIGPLLSVDLRQCLESFAPYNVIDSYLNGAHFNQISHPLEPYVYAGLKVSLPYDMLVKVDRMSMANSLEVRVPLLDQVLVDYVSNVPIPQRFPYMRLKGLLKDVMADILPDKILNQPKHGFGVPLTTWFRGDWATFTGDVLLSQSARQSGFWNIPAIETLLRGYHRTGFNSATLLWSLLVFGIWKQDVLKFPK
jgi:asparagine synthase (glutamine-hydrolysing)